MNIKTRYIRQELLNCLNSSPVVFLNGPRQAGKSTLVQDLAKTEIQAEYVTFDSNVQMMAAVNSPESYLRERKKSLIIDEVQLVPEIFRALKIVVDELRYQSKTRVVGKFLLTGSANILALPNLSDSLVGRMQVITLYPFSGAEALGTKNLFLDSLFNLNFYVDNQNVSLNDVISAATFPEVSTTSSKHYNHWFDSYITTLLQRDVRALAEIDKLRVMPNLLRLLANRAGCLLNNADLARDAGLNAVTFNNYKTLLKMLFLVIEIPPWYRNIGKRLVKSSKAYLVDSLMLCHLLAYDIDTLKQTRPEIFGHVIENFVATEIVKQISIVNKGLKLYHFRTSDNKEVDFVIEKPDGKLVGIEVKNRESVNHKDFEGLSALKTATKTDFVCGVILYRGKDIVPFGEGLWAIPISAIWS
ncbi:MAG: ATP-binding protein [Rickettsiales bacterium]|nr:ATP-binding protein [Rickettsiales bacterium]